MRREGRGRVGLYTDVKDKISGREGEEGRLGSSSLFTIAGERMGDLFLSHKYSLIPVHIRDK